MKEAKKPVTLEDLLDRFNRQNKQFIKNIDKEECMDRVESFKSIENDIKGDKFQTEINKNKFIDDIKSDLGKKIKSNPSGIIIIKKPWYVKLKDFIKKIFTKF